MNIDVEIEGRVLCLRQTFSYFSEINVGNNLEDSFHFSLLSISMQSFLPQVGVVCERCNAGVCCRSLVDQAGCWECWPTERPGFTRAIA